MGIIDPIPSSDPVLDGPYISGSWYRWLAGITGAVAATPTIFSAQIRLTDQHAAIPTTNIPLPGLSQGNYLVSYYARVTTADGVASSLQVTMGWTDPDGSISAAISDVPLTLDSITLPRSNVYLADVKGNTPITYATAYSSNTPDQMRYKLNIVVQAVP